MITDPQAIRFSNDTLRTFADAYVGAYQRAKEIQIRWASEGAHVDGRTVVTGADANDIVDAANQLVASLDANSMELLLRLSKYSVNPR
jgi:hypothetical protein